MCLIHVLHTCASCALYAHGRIVCLLGLVIIQTELVLSLLVFVRFKVKMKMSLEGHVVATRYFLSVADLSATDYGIAAECSLCVCVCINH